MYQLQQGTHMLLAACSSHTVAISWSLIRSCGLHCGFSACRLLSHLTRKINGGFCSADVGLVWRQELLSALLFDQGR